MACWRLQANFLLLCWDHVALPSLCPLCQSGLWSLGPTGLPVQARRDHKSQSQQESSGPPPQPHLHKGPCCQRKSITLFCKDQSRQRPGPKPAQTQQVSPALLALNPLAGVHWGRGRSSRGAQLQRCRGVQSPREGRGFRFRGRPCWQRAEAKGDMGRS